MYNGDPYIIIICLAICLYFCLALSLRGPLYACTLHCRQQNNIFCSVPECRRSCSYGQTLNTASCICGENSSRNTSIANLSAFIATLSPDVHRSLTPQYHLKQTHCTDKGTHYVPFITFPAFLRDSGDVFQVVWHRLTVIM